MGNEACLDHLYRLISRQTAHGPFSMGRLFASQTTAQCFLTASYRLRPCHGCLRGKLLVEEGYRVTIQVHPERDFALSNELSPGLFIVDYMLPTTDDTWSLLQLLRLNPSTIRTPRSDQSDCAYLPTIVSSSAATMCICASHC